MANDRPMATPKPAVDWGQRLQSVPKNVLFLILFIFASVPLFFPVELPNEPIDASIDFYTSLMKLPEGSKVLIGSDWTNSTRGESGGEMEALLRILMRKNIKFAVYSTGDAQAPQVARDVIGRIAKEVADDKGPVYKPFKDYVVTGYFPNSEGTTLAINNNVLAAFAGRKDNAETGAAQDVLTSPVFEGVKSVADFKYLVLVTASSTNTITLERIKKVPLMFMVTGVMVPENIVYYSSGQLKGMCGGVKGVKDLETLMTNGTGDVKPVEGMEKLRKENKLKGSAYYPTLHFCIVLLIVAVALGNIGMFLSRRTPKGGTA